MKGFLETQVKVVQETARNSCMQTWAYIKALPEMKGPHRCAENLAMQRDPKRRLLKRITKNVGFGPPLFRLSSQGLKFLRLTSCSSLADNPTPTVIERDMAALRFCFAVGTRRQRLMKPEIEKLWEQLPTHLYSSAFCFEEETGRVLAVKPVGERSARALGDSLLEEAKHLAAVEPFKGLIDANRFGLVVVTYDAVRAEQIRSEFPKYPPLPIAAEVVPRRPDKEPADANAAAN